MSTLIVLLTFAVALAELTPATGAGALDAAEVACLVQKDATACAEAFRTSGLTEDAAVFAGAGCDSGTAPRSCVNLGDVHLARGRGDDAAAAYARACDGGATPGCHRLIASGRRAADALTGDALKRKISEMDAWYQRACPAAPAAASPQSASAQSAAAPATVPAPAAVSTQTAVPAKPAVSGAAAGPDGDPQCDVSRTLIAEARRRTDENFGRCGLETEVFRNDGSAEPIQVTGNSDRPIDLSGRAECAEKCRTWIEKFPTADSVRLRMRARCVFRGETLGATAWRVLNEGGPCSTENKIIGTDPRPLFARCHCERQMFTAATPTFDRFGVYARGDGTLASNFGGRKWFRCTAALYWSDPAASRSAPDCGQRVSAVRRGLATDPSARGTVFNYAHLECGRAGAR